MHRRPPTPTMSLAHGQVRLGALIAVAALTGCVPSSSATPPVACPEAGCTVLAVAFEEPLSLDEVVDLADQTATDVVALWRTDPICVPVIDGPPMAETRDVDEPSWFAYVDADVIRETQNPGPPATDGGWSAAMRDRFVVEWNAAQEPGVAFEGAALLSRPSQDELEGVARFLEVESYVTDAGVLYLRGHAAAFEPLGLEHGRESTSDEVCQRQGNE